MYAYAWKSGLKTTYYLRSRPATRIQQATVSGASTSTMNTIAAAPPPNESADDGAITCSLETPETCEACQ